MKVYIGFDQREEQAYEVAQKSLRRFWPGAPVEALKSDRLAACGLLRRPWTHAGSSTTWRAMHRARRSSRSRASWCRSSVSRAGRCSSTATSSSLADVARSCSPWLRPVEGGHGGEARSRRRRAEDGRPGPDALRAQELVERVLFNCDHPANRRLSLQDVNERPGGTCTPSTGWRIRRSANCRPNGTGWSTSSRNPNDPKIAHFTEGGPFLPGWDTGAHEHDALWLEASRG
jgi:hypothetical protein